MLAMKRSRGNWTIYFMPDGAFVLGRKTPDVPSFLRLPNTPLARDPSPIIHSWAPATGFRAGLCWARANLAKYKKKNVFAPCCCGRPSSRISIPFYMPFRDGWWIPPWHGENLRKFHLADRCRPANVCGELKRTALDDSIGECRQPRQPAE